MAKLIPFGRRVAKTNSVAVEAAMARLRHDYVLAEAWDTIAAWAGPDEPATEELRGAVARLVSEHRRFGASLAGANTRTNHKT